MTSIGEERYRKIFENILSEKFPNVRPSWLKNHETGYLLELDGYSKSLKLAFHTMVSSITCFQIYSIKLVANSKNREGEIR